MRLEAFMIGGGGGGGAGCSDPTPDEGGKGGTHSASSVQKLSQSKAGMTCTVKVGAGGTRGVADGGSGGTGGTTSVICNSGPNAEFKIEQSGGAGGGHGGNGNGDAGNCTTYSNLDQEAVTACVGSCANSGGWKSDGGDCSYIGGGGGGGGTDSGIHHGGNGGPGFVQIRYKEKTWKPKNPQ